MRRSSLSGSSFQVSRVREIPERISSIQSDRTNSPVVCSAFILPVPCVMEPRTIDAPIAIRPEPWIIGYVLINVIVFPIGIRTWNLLIDGWVVVILDVISQIPKVTLQARGLVGACPNRPQSVLALGVSRLPIADLVAPAGPVFTIGSHL